MSLNSPEIVDSVVDPHQSFRFYKVPIDNESAPCCDDCYHLGDPSICVPLRQVFREILIEGQPEGDFISTINVCDDYVHYSEGPIFDPEIKEVESAVDVIVQDRIKTRHADDFSDELFF